MAGEVAKIVVSIGGDTYQLEQAVGKSKKELGGLSQTAKEVGGMVAAFFAVDRLMSFAGSIITIRSEFEKYSAVLANSLGSQKQSADAMAMLQKFAAQTPYQLTELTDAYVKLINRGLRPSEAELTRVGDFAAATGKSFGQLNEAILDANNPERWKEFGVQTKTMGDKVQLTFRGVTVEVERSAAGAMKAVEAFGQLDGIAGTMGAQMETLGGKVSNLKDSWDQLLNKLGESSIWKNVVGGLNMVISSINESIDKSKQISTGISEMGLQDTFLGKTSEAYQAALELNEIEKQKNQEILEEIKNINDVGKAREYLIRLANRYDDKLDEINAKQKQGIQITVDDAQTKALFTRYTTFIDDLLKSDKNISNIITGTEPQKEKAKGYIESLEIKIKELTEKLKKEPNVNLLAPLQIELNKTKKELDDVLKRLDSIGGHPTAEIPDLVTPLSGKVATKPTNMYKDTMDLMKRDLKEFKKEVLDISQDLNSSLAEVFVSIAEGIGQAIAGSGAENILQNFIASLGGLMASFGKMLIAWGVAQIALEESISEPYVAIAAGAALVAIGSAMSQKSSEITGSQSSNYGSRYGGEGRATNEQLTQHVEFDIRGDIIRAIVRNDNKIVQRIR